MAGLTSAVRETGGLPQDFGRELLRDIEGGRVRLPTLPETAMKIWEVVRSPRSSTPEISRALERDPPLAAKLLKSANSSAYAGAMPAVRLEQAVIRLGRSDVRNLVIATCAKDLYRAKTPAAAALMSELWTHSLAVALASQHLARSVDFPEKDASFLAGLLHDIGKIVVVTRAESLPGSRVEPCRAVLDPSYARLHAACGAGVMMAWGLPHSLVEVCLHSGGAASAIPGAEPPVLTRVVDLADAVARKLGLDAACIAPDPRAVEQTARNLGLDEVILGDVESELESRVAELNRAW